MTPQTVDFITPFDPTGYPTISGAELQQFVSGLAPQAYIGWNVVTDDDNAGIPSVPNANTTTKWKYFNWLRRTKNGGVVLYVWNPASATDATYLNWQVANVSSITTGSITGSQIAANTITGNNIAATTIPWGCMVNAAAVGGCLTGSLPNPALANGVVGNSTIAVGAIQGGNPDDVGSTSNIAKNTIVGANLTSVDAKAIKDANVMSIAQAGGGLLTTGVTGKLQLPAGAVYGMINRVAAGAATWESVFNSFIKDLSGDILTAQPLYFPRVKSDISGLEMSPVASIQTVRTEVTAAITVGTNTMGFGLLPDNSQDATHGQNVNNFDTAFTSKSATSKVRVTLNMTVGASNANTFVVWVMDGATLIGVKPVHIEANTVPFQLQASFVYSPASTAAKTYKLYVGCAIAGTPYINRDGTNASYFTGGKVVSSMTVEEVQ